MICLFLSRVGEDGNWSDNHGILTPTNQTNFKITNLHPYTVYSFRVLAVNGMGASQPSKESYYMVTLREREFILMYKSMLSLELNESNGLHASLIVTRHTVHSENLNR